MIKDVFLGVDWILFFHFAGIIIGLGATTVIDTLGFSSRKSKDRTQTTINAHHITKPLIWIGIILVLSTWVLINLGDYNFNLSIEKSLIIFLLLCNGIFLSFYVSPRLDTFIGEKVLLPKNLQIKIAISLVVSFILWWSLVLITIFNFS